MNCAFLLRCNSFPQNVPISEFAGPFNVIVKIDSVVESELTGNFDEFDRDL